MSQNGVWSTTTHNFHTLFLLSHQMSDTPHRMQEGEACWQAAIYLACILSTPSSFRKGGPRGKSWKLLLLIHESRTAMLWVCLFRIILPTTSGYLLQQCSRQLLFGVYYDNCKLQKMDAKWVGRLAGAEIGHWKCCCQCANVYMYDQNWGSIWVCNLNICSSLLRICEGGERGGGKCRHGRH